MRFLRSDYEKIFLIKAISTEVFLPNLLLVKPFTPFLGIKKILYWKFVYMQDSGDRHYHLYLGTSKGCVVDVTFSVTPSTTEVNMEVELLVQGHGDEITGLSSAGDNFITCGLDKTLIMWDTISHKAKWVEAVRSPLTCVALSQDGSKFAAGSQDGHLYYTDVEERSLVR